MCVGGGEGGACYIFPCVCHFLLITRSEVNPDLYIYERTDAQKVNQSINQIFKVRGGTYKGHCGAMD